MHGSQAAGHGELLDRDEQSALHILGDAQRQFLHRQQLYLASRHRPREHRGALLFRSADHRDRKGNGPWALLDGGLTPHNNPSLALFLTAVLPPYRLEWKTGVDNLFIWSVGTGSCRPKLTTREARRAPAILLAINALAAQISDNQELTLTLMSWLGESSLPWPINSEVGDLKDATPPFGKLFRYHRCDIKLEREWLAQNTGVPLTENDILKLRQMENPANIPALYNLGRIAAQQQITREMLEAML